MLSPLAATAFVKEIALCVASVGIKSTSHLGLLLPLLTRPAPLHNMTRQLCSHHSSLFWAEDSGIRWRSGHARCLRPPQKSTNIRIIQDYFQQTIGNVKKVLLTYGANGRSRGMATIIFRTGTDGQKAVKQLDGVKVDNKPMKVC